MSAPLIDWGAVPRLGIGVIDAAHRDVVDRINAFHAYLSEGRIRKSSFEKHVNGLYGAVGDHFTAEEILMRTVRFPGLGNHMVAHTKLKRELWNMRQQLINNRGEITEAVLTPLRVWFVNHIRDADLLYLEHVTANRLDVQALAAELFDSDSAPPGGVTDVPPVPRSQSIARGGGYRRILVGLDATEQAGRALNLAIGLARLRIKAKAGVTGFHVDPSAPIGVLLTGMGENLPQTDDGESALEAVRAGFKPLLAPEGLSLSERHLAQGKQLCARAAIPFAGKTLAGPCDRAVAAEVATGRHDLLLVGAAGQAAILENGPEGVGLRLLRRVAIDILLIKRPKALKQEGPILVALDSSPRSYGALLMALELAVLWKRPLILAAVAADPCHDYLAREQSTGAAPAETAGADAAAPSGEGGADANGPPPGLIDYLQIHLMHAHRLAEKRGVTARRLLLQGHPVTALTALAAEQRPSLVALGRTGLHGDAALDLGGVAESLLQALPCDFFISHRGHWPQWPQPDAADGAAADGPTPEELAAQTPALEWDLEAEQLLNELQEDGPANMLRKVIESVAARRELGRVDPAFVRRLLEPGREDGGLMFLESMPWDKEARELLAPYPPGLRTLMIEAIEASMWRSGVQRIGADGLLKVLDGWRQAGSEEIQQSDPGRIAQVLKAALADRTRIQVRIPEVKTVFRSVLEPLPGHKSTASEAVAHLNRHDHLLLAPLSGEGGDALLAEKGWATLRLHQFSRTLECYVPVLGRETDDQGRELFKLGFPETLSDRADLRQYKRVGIDPEMGFRPRVYITMSKAFVADVYNISAGGISFSPTTDKFKITDGMKLRFLLEPTEAISFSLYGHVTGRYELNGKVWIEAQFDIMSEKAMESLLQTIAHFRRLILERLQAGSGG